MTTLTILSGLYFPIAATCVCFAVVFGRLLFSVWYSSEVGFSKALREIGNFFILINCYLLNYYLILIIFIIFFLFLYLKEFIYVFLDSWD